MTSLEMLMEFKVGFDKIDSESYPEIYNEQIFMFINKAIDLVVNEGRRVFEKDQIVTDNLKSLLPKKPLVILPSENTDTEYLFDLTKHDYLFYIRGSCITTSKGVESKASIKVTQQDDIDIILQDPYNRPRVYKIPVTFSRDTITAYTTPDFKVKELHITFVKKPIKVDINTNCDLDVQLHYSLVDTAIKLAAVSLGMIKQDTNN